MVNFALRRNPNQFSATRRIEQLLADARIRPMLAAIDKAQEPLVDLTIQIQQIASPTFAEGERAEFVCAYFQQIGLRDVRKDPLHNVFGRLAGRNATLPPLIVSAHSDTVFPADTDLTVKREGHLIFGPGIADNSAGVAGLLVMAKLLVQHGLQPDRDIWFVVNSAEEGLGDLRGMREVIKRFPEAAGFVVVEGGMYGYVLHEGIGVRRYEIRVETEGGHSWSDFGRKNAIHILSQIVSRIDTIRVPKSPKTSFNVGVFEGGTSVNTIAADALLQLDLRSEDSAALEQLFGQVQLIVHQAQRRHERARIRMIKIGDRPAGACPRNSQIVQLASAALRASGSDTVHFLRGSTDANMPLSHNKPAVCIGLAQSANAHRLDEYLDSDLFTNGVQQLLLLTLGLTTSK